MPLCGYNLEMAAGLKRFAVGISNLQPKEGDMTFCGYNKDMAGGLEQFAQGLAVQTDKRAVEEGVSVPQIPDIELNELDRFIASVRGSAKQEELAGIVGLAVFVRYMYAQIKKLTATDPSMTARAAFEVVVEQTNTLMFDMEDHYYAELRPKLGIEKAIEALGPYLEARV